MPKWFHEKGNEAALPAGPASWENRGEPDGAARPGPSTPARPAVAHPPMLTEIRLACRRLRRSPGFTGVAVLTLALGLGLNTSMFSLMNALLLRPLPYPRGEDLVRVFVTTPQADDWALTAPVYRQVREAGTGFGRLAAFGWWGASLTEPGRPPEMLVSVRATAEFLPTLGVPPELGRWFTPEEDRPGSAVVLISHRLWRTRFGGDPGIVGRTIHVDREPVTVVGVMPERIDAPMVFGVVDFWRPLALTAAQWEDRTERWLHVVGRLGPGQSPAAAGAALTAIAARLARDQPLENDHHGLRLVPLHASATDGAARRMTWLTLGLTGFVLLIACANLANLQLARALARSREITLRAALGATRVQLLRPLVVESLVLAGAGGLAGLLVAMAANRWIGAHIVFNNAPPGQPLPLDGRVLLFALGVSLATGLVCGCVPGWLSARTQLATALRDNGRGTTAGRRPHRLRAWLVVGEIALALVLLCGAGVVLGGLREYLRRDTGWRPGGMVFGGVGLQTPNYRDDEAAVRFYERMVERLAALPGVEGVAFGWDLPVAPNREPRPFEVEGRGAAPDGREPLAYCNGVLPGYFDGLGIALVEGRDFTRRDRTGSPRVAIVGEALARAFWPGESALGKRIRGTDPRHPEWMEIVGVVRDVQFAGSLANPPTRLQFYQPFAQVEVWRWGSVGLRTRGAPESLVEPLRRAVAELDPDIPVWEARTVSAEIDRRLANSQLTGQLLGGVALLGLLLAALGIYGVVSQMVAQRTTEIGVRLALGADLAAIYRMVLGSGCRLAVLGVVFGAVGAVGVARLAAVLLPEVPGASPWVFAVTTVALAGATVVATWLPARRAGRIDPVVALRGD